MNATILEAKDNLSDLVSRAQAGEEVIITSELEGEPLARLQALNGTTHQRLGSMATPGWELGEAFWEPLPADWEGTRE